MFHRPLRTLRVPAAAAAALIVLLVDRSFAFGLHPTRPQQIPYQTALKASTLSNEEEMQTSSDDVEHPSSFLSLQDIQRLTNQAIEHRGTDVGYQALQTLGRACQQRVPYDFANHDIRNVQPVRQLIPLEVTQQVSEIVPTMEAEGCLSNNLDSVDGLPSFHLNLVSNGKPLFPKPQNDTNSSSGNTLFEQRTHQLLELVEPYIYNELLPQVQRLHDNLSNNDNNCKRTMKVGDVFLRRYGQDSEDARNGISAHYDVFSKITAVIAMDNVAAEGRHGLFTTALSSSSSSSGSATSNHKSLRRYFPLSEGDAVMHSWDVLHGVDVLPGMGRTSLIVWFIEEKTTCSDDDGETHAKTNSVENVSPWLLTDTARIATDEVTQFVLASALESVKDLDGDDSTASKSSSYSSQELYLKSATQHSAFALSRLGSLCEADDWKSPELLKQAQELLDVVCPVEQIPAPLRPILFASEEAKPHQQQRVQILPEHQSMAWRFWLQAARLGNPQAQLALADDLMAHATTSLEGSNDKERDDARLLASVLFGLAAQQGLNDALERLSRVVGFEMAKKQIATQEDFLNSPVVQTAQIATAAMET